MVCSWGIVGGETIEGGLRMGRQSDSELVNIFSDDATIAHEYAQLRILFIDEVSMVGSAIPAFQWIAKLHAVHLRCEKLFGKSARGQPFTGLPVVCIGDFNQLQPMLDSWIFLNDCRGHRDGFTAPN